MKNLNLIYALLLLLALTSCKKDRLTNQKTSSNKPPLIADVRDSISYTVDGKIYTTDTNPTSYLNTGGEETDRKVVYADNNNIHNYALIGNPDSVLYYQKNTISSGNVTLGIFFLKKFIKKNKGDGLIFNPGLNDLLKLFTVGKYQYAEDFGWENAQNGIALNITANDKVYTSYNAFNVDNPVEIEPGFQKTSTFEIISFAKATSGGYNLQAKFTALVIDNTTGEQKKLDNGYLRIYFVPIVAANGN